MTDFYSVLQRAVSALPDKNGANRRAVYDKARKALVKQLQSFDPPLPSSEVTAQRLALEDAIRRLESEIARSARTRRAVQSAMPPAAAEAGTPPRGAGRASEPVTDAAPQQPEAAAPLAANADPTAQRDQADAAETTEREQPAAVAPAGAPDPVAAPAGHEGASGGPPTPVAAAHSDPERARAAPSDHATRRAERRARRERERAERQTRRSEQRTPPAATVEPEAATSAESEGAVRSSVDTGRGDGGTDDAFAESDTIAAEVAGEDVASAADDTGTDASRKADDVAPERAPPQLAAKRFDRARPPRSPAARMLVPLVVLLVVAGVGAAAYTQREQILALIEPGDSGGASTDTAAPQADAEHVTTKVTDRLGAPQDPETDPDTRQVRTTRIVTRPDGPRVSADETSTIPDSGTASPAHQVASAAPDANGGAGGTAAQAGRESTATQDARNGKPGTDTAAQDGVVETAALDEAAETTAPEAADLPPSEASVEASAVREATPAAPNGAAGALGANTGSGPQVAVLYEEGEKPGAKGAALPGKVSWEAVEASVGGQDPEWVVRATATVPERDLTVKLTIRENHDDTLPASHLIELSFITPDDFPGGGIANVPGMIMKKTEEERGNALLGAAARVSSGLFWIALSSGEEDEVQNKRLLSDRAWIDIPILYENGRRAILTLQKGESGERAVAQALKAWEKG